MRHSPGWGNWFQRRRTSEPEPAAWPAGSVVAAALQRLPPEHREVLLSRFGHGWSVAQIARASHRTRAEVSLQQLLALRALQHELESRASGRWL